MKVGLLELGAGLFFKNAEFKLQANVQTNSEIVYSIGISTTSSAVILGKLDKSGNVQMLRL